MLRMVILPSSDSMNKFIFTTVILFGNILSLKSQDVHFSQWNNSPMLINPAATGVFDGYTRAVVGYRNQWATMGAGYKTMAAAVDMPVYLGKRTKKQNNTYLGVGLNLFSDRAGDTKFGTNSALLNVSSIISLSKSNRIGVGIQLGILNKNFNLNNVFLEEQYTGSGFSNSIISNEKIETSRSVLDLGAGIFYEKSPAIKRFAKRPKVTYRMGLAAFHIHRPQQNFLLGTDDQLHMKLVGSTQVKIDLNAGKYTLLPQAFVATQGPHLEVNAGMLYRMRINDGTRITIFYTEQAFALGLHYRLNDAIIPSVYYEINNFAIGFSYDINLSSYTAVSKAKGGFELTLKYVNLNGGELYKRRANPSRLRSPHF